MSAAFDICKATILSAIPHLDESERQKLAVIIKTDSQDLIFEDETRSVHWDGGSIQFSKKAFQRYKLLKILWVSPSRSLSAAEIGEILYGDERKDWDTIRKLGNNTETQNLEPKNFPFFIEPESQNLKLVTRNIFP
jgi:hypothetical protein